jgi:membrane-bound serine protease (ClpP class)
LQKSVLLPIAILLILTPIHQAYCEPQQPILLVKIKSEITPATTMILEDAIATAEGIGAQLVIVELDTPGGLVTAVKEIMSLFESSPIPICVFVYPLGATAWSGGTYILVSSHVAAMASGTTIGSAQPVNSTGQPITESKYTNALIALMVNHAKIHGRNTTAAEQFVTKNLNLGPETALRYNVIEIIADDVPTLLRLISGKSLIRVLGEAGESRWLLIPREQTSEYNFAEYREFTGVSDAQVVNYQRGLQSSLLELIYNPLVTGLLLTLGLLLLLFGIQTPGLGAELVGVILLILGLMSSEVIGLEPTVIILFILGGALIVGEFMTQTGFLGLAGIVVILLGAFLIFPSPNWLISPEFAWTTSLTIVIISLPFVVLLGVISYKVGKAITMRHKTGAETLIGSKAVVVTDLNPEGEVRVQGEIWRAEALDPPIKKGVEVEVVGRQGLVIQVKKVSGKSFSSVRGEKR